MTLIVGVLLLEVAARAHQRAAGAEAGDEVGDLRAVAPDLRARCPRSGRAGWRRCRTGRGSTTRGARRPAAWARRTAPLRALRARREDDLGAEHLEHLAALDRHVLGQHDLDRVALELGDRRQGDAGVARRRLEDRLARLQQPVLLGLPRSSPWRCGPSPSRTGSGSRAWRGCARRVRATARLTSTIGVLPIRSSTLAWTALIPAIAPE